MIHIAIIDDDKNFINALAEKIHSISNNFIVDVFDNQKDFSAVAHQYNIAYIDIMLDSQNGIDFAKKTLKENPELKIVFMSVEADFFRDVYSVEHLYFLTKPIEDAKLRESLNICYEKVKKDLIFLRKNKSIESVDLNNIMYFEGILKRTTVYFSDSTSKIYNIPLREIEAMLNRNDFIRTHQSYIVNLNFVTHVTKNRLKIGAVEIPVSRSKIKTAADAVSAFLSTGL